MKQYKCIKNYHPIVTKLNGKKEPTTEPVVKKGDILTQIDNTTKFISKNDKTITLYEYTIKKYSDCFSLIN